MSMSLRNLALFITDYLGGYGLKAPAGKRKPFEK